MNTPTNTLGNLLLRVQRLINDQGADAPAAAFIFTNEDVFTWENDGGEQVPVERTIAANILNSIEDDYDYLYTEVFNCIDEELRSRGLIEG